MKNYKIVIVSSGQPCGNPRMVKEAVSLSKYGHQITVIYAPISIWGDNFDKELIFQNPQINWIRVGAHPKENPINYLLSRIRKKIWEQFYLIFGNIFESALKSIVLYSQDLYKESKKHNADLFIGHNLGALYAVVRTAEINSAKVCFDFEDFHRGEDLVQSLHYNKVKIIEDQFVNKLSFAYTASPLISKAYSQLYPNLLFETINNCFPLKYQSVNKSKIDFPIKLYWFSQFIGKNRGIEQIIEAIGLLKEFDLTLTLLGNLKEDEKEYFQNLINQFEIDHSKINFISPVSQKKIFEIASEHHIGFASEPGKDFNNNIALSNKIFTYLLAGNAIMFSNTEAQKHFFEENSNIGYLYSNGNSTELANLIKKYILSPELLNEHRMNSLNLSNKLNWEIESKKLVKLINCNI